MYIGINWRVCICAVCREWEDGKMGSETTVASLGNHPLVILLTLLGNASKMGGIRREDRTEGQQRISLNSPTSNTD